ncbi:Uncharacterised protein [Shigella sonnei]|nr:Uncharacterised protein [Shigella sonnei]
MISVVPAAVIIPATYMLRQVYNQILARLYYRVEININRGCTCSNT